MDQSRTKQAIAKLVRSTNKLTLSALAQQAGVNRGQLSAWVNGGGSLKTDRIPLLIETLVSEIDKHAHLPLTFLESNANEIEFLRSLTALSNKPTTGAAALAPLDAAISPDHVGFCIREVERDLFKRIKSEPPISLSIVGYRKTGKSTAANWVYDKTKSTSLALYYKLDEAANCSSAEALMKWLDEETQQQLDVNFRFPITEPDELPDWINDNLLSRRQNLSDCVHLIFDGVDLLQNDAQCALLLALHFYFTAKVRNENLDFVNIILSLDTWSSILGGSDRGTDSLPDDIKEAAASLFRESHTVRAGNLYYGSLLELVARRVPETQLQGQSSYIAGILWSQFHGHPWLTQAWLNEFVNDSINPLEVKNDFQTKIFDKFIDYIDINEIADPIILENIESALSSSADTQSLCVSVIKNADLRSSIHRSKISATKLIDSGLYYRSEDSNQICCTRSIAEFIRRYGLEGR